MSAPAAHIPSFQRTTVNRSTFPLFQLSHIGALLSQASIAELALGYFSTAGAETCRCRHTERASQVPCWCLGKCMSSQYTDDVTRDECDISPSPGPAWPQARFGRLVRPAYHGLVLAQHSKLPVENHPCWLSSDVPVENAYWSWPELA